MVYRCIRTKSTPLVDYYRGKFVLRITFCIILKILKRLNVQGRRGVRWMCVCMCVCVSEKHHWNPIMKVLHIILCFFLFLWNTCNVTTGDDKKGACWVSITFTLHRSWRDVTWRDDWLWPRSRQRRSREICTVTQPDLARLSSQQTSGVLVFCLSVLFLPSSNFFFLISKGKKSWNKHNFQSPKKKSVKTATILTYTFQ